MKKNYLKTNLISFIVGVVVFSCIGVYAVVNFPSNEVTYNNKESGLKSTNVKDAIDELYTECTKEPTAGETIIENAGLEKDPYECRYFFTGADPNNYITFNDEKAGWRIISVECDGTIKIMRTAGLGNQAWDSSSNNWARPSTLNTYLNNTYYNVLASTTKSQIVAKDWSIGAIVNDNNDLAQQINDENSIFWKEYIGLITTSEYIRTNSNIKLCGTQSLLSSNTTTCRDTTWMFNKDDFWTISAQSDTNNETFHIISFGYITTASTNVKFNDVRPALYLSSEIKITGGTGTSQDPYQISM